MRDMSKLFGLPESLFGAIKGVQKEENEYQQKVRAHMQKKGIKSLGELTPEQKKTFFKEVDALHQAKNEEVEIEEESGSGTVIAKASAQKKRAEISQKIADAKTKHGRELDSLKKQKSSVSEEFEEIDEQGKIVKGKGYDNPENERKAPEGKLDLTSLMPGYNERAAKFFGVQAKGRLVKGKAQSAPQKEEAELEESFSAAMVAKLKDEYGKINTIDPSGDGYKKLIAMLDKMDKKDLQTLASAGIKFVSGLARNRVNRMKNEEVIGESVKGTLWRVEQAQSGRFYAVKGYNKSRKVWKNKNKSGAGDFNDKKSAQAKVDELNRGVAEGSLEEGRPFSYMHRLGRYGSTRRTPDRPGTTTGSSPTPAPKSSQPVNPDKSKEKKNEELEKDSQKLMDEAKMNEAAVEKVRKAVKKMKEEAPSSKESSMKAGEKLSGKKEPIEINPEISEK